LDILQRRADLSNAQIAKLTQLSRTKIAQIRREYDLTGDVRVTQGCNHKSLQKQQTEERQKEAILAIIGANPRCGLKEIIDKLQSQYGLHLRRSSVHKRLTRDLGYAFLPLSPVHSAPPTLNDESTVFSRYFCSYLEAYSALLCGGARWTRFS
jgi:transposase